MMLEIFMGVKSLNRFMDQSFLGLSNIVTDVVEDVEGEIL